MAGTIVVGVDGSEGSRLALSWAAEDAVARGARIEAVTVCRGLPEEKSGRHLLRTASHPLDLAMQLKTDDARQRLLDTVSEIGKSYPDLRIEPQLLEGDPAQMLCRRAEQAEVLVVGARGRTRFAPLALGSVASKCADHSPGPVVIVPAREQKERQRSSSRAGRVVVGVDMSEGSRHALGWALREAQARHWTIEAVTVWGRVYDYGADFYWPVDGEVEKNLRSGLDKLVEGVACDAPRVPVELVVLEGDPGQQLIERARDAELLVVGSRGHGVFASLLLGSVASRCARHSPRPVVVVRPRQPRE